MLDMLLPNASRVIFVTPNTRVCATRSAIVMGHRPGIFLGQSDATFFRERTFRRLGLDIRPRQNEDLAYPLRVRLFNRNTNRRIVAPSYSEITKMFNDNGGNSTFDVQFMDEMAKLDFTAQVKVFANADLLIMPHGAGITNVIFARNHVPVIELFPRHFVKYTYRQIATMSGHPYFSLMSNRMNSIAFRAHPIDEVNCEYWHGIDVINELHCHHQYLKHAQISVNQSQLLQVTQQALEMLPLHGYIYPAGRQYYDPVRPADQPLGIPAP
eukprot:c4397_g1_i1.p1 GENE.c4397_g1_i1~~c4397_g1_i1.p1  ORF type:complete len:269 (-),score=52.91 c4397_g1_i1:1108-1914(-)